MAAHPQTRLDVATTTRCRSGSRAHIDECGNDPDEIGAFDATIPAEAAVIRCLPWPAEGRTALNV
jgi:hypothetical protein